MKKCWIIGLLLCVISLPVGGCATVGECVGKDWQQNVPQIKENAFTFTRLGTRIALVEAKMSKEDIGEVRSYLVAVRDLLAMPGEPNFAGARALVKDKLQQKYRTYGLIVVDLLERYLNSIDISVTEDQELVISILVAGVDGAIAAVDEMDAQ
jgi:hypothetical protein